MPEQTDVSRQMIRGVRAGDARLSTSGVRRAGDPGEVERSVLPSFFHRAASGQFDREDSRDLARLLAVVAGNECVDRHRRMAAPCLGGLGLGLLPGKPPGPGEAGGADTLAALRCRLSPPHQGVFDLLQEGLPFPTIGPRVRRAADHLRRGYRAAVEGVCGRPGVGLFGGDEDV